MGKGENGSYRKEKESNKDITGTLFLKTFNVPVTKMPSTNVFNELCVKITPLRSIPKKL